MSACFQVLIISLVALPIRAPETATAGAARGDESQLQFQLGWPNNLACQTAEMQN